MTVLNNIKTALLGFVLPFFIVVSPIFFAFALTKNRVLCVLAVLTALTAFLVRFKNWHNVDFDENSKTQKDAFNYIALILAVFSFFLCAVSIEGELMHDYPLSGSVDDYGCYIQTFDAFQKGRLDIDTDFDLSVFESLDNPYDTNARRELLDEKIGVYWDRAYYDGKLFSYFGVAPIIFLYYPAFILTGKVLSDALVSAILSAIFCFLSSALVFALCRSMERKPPFLLALLGAAVLPFGALLFPTLVNANFYHIAVLAGMVTVLGFFLCVLNAVRSKDGAKRKALFALSGFLVALIVASRPNMVLYVFVALPLLISVIKKCEYGKKSLLFDVFAFSVPMVLGSVAIMLYNYARFGSPFDFGTAYQLTVTDTSVYSFEFSLILPTVYHYFMQHPKVDDVFPYIHIAARRFVDYGIDHGVYTSRSIGVAFFPASWGIAFLPWVHRNKTRFATALMAIVTVVFIAFFDMCFAGVHLRYVTDIMFVAVLLGIMLLLTAVSETQKHSFSRAILFAVAVSLFFATVLVSLPMVFDNERVMIARTHPEFFLFFAGEF